MCSIQEAWFLLKKRCFKDLAMDIQTEIYRRKSDVLTIKEYQIMPDEYEKNIESVYKSKEKGKA